MRVYVLGAGASVSAGYPLASQLLRELSSWLDRCDSSVHWVPWARNRIVQIRETFGSLDDFEATLGRLEEYGQQRVKPARQTTYRQDYWDIAHDCMERLQGVDCGDPNIPAQGFYPQYLRSDLIGAFREFFYHVEELRTKANAYDDFAGRKACPDSCVITFNYDIALERALAKAGTWDIGNGYGFQFLPDRPASKLTVYKLHGSVNWFKHPTYGEYQNEENDQAPGSGSNDPTYEDGWRSLVGRAHHDDRAERGPQSRVGQTRTGFR